MQRARASILRYDTEGKPYFRMDEIFRIQEFLSSDDRNSDSLCYFQDSFGNQQSYDTKGRDRTTLVELRSLQYYISYVHKFGIEKPLYSPGLVKGNPAIAATNESLVEDEPPIDGRHPRDSPALINLARVREIFEEAQGEFHGSYLPPSIMEALSNVEKHIDNIVCFDLGTFEADVCGPLVNNWGVRRCAAHHLLALMIKDYVAAARPGKATQLIVQHSEYTDNTATVLKEQGCIVLRNNTTAFRHITENSLVIWTGKEGPMPVPVKQIIADFPFQETPLPVPRAMIWPEEEPTTMEDALDPDEIFLEPLPYSIGWISLSREDTLRTNQLHRGYNRHRLPSLPDDDPFSFFYKALAVYTRQ
ncbi:hypothetical protein F5B21DRAFT_505091 [Xylaria acuta]|nr:hypothetical protein F5B21DRAFT_505091 [Xylaria acuta]